MDYKFFNIIKIKGFKNLKLLWMRKYVYFKIYKFLKFV